MLFIIDGSALLTTHFFGNMPIEIMKEKDVNIQNEMAKTLLERDNQGRYTNGISSMLYYILDLINIYKPEQMIIAFDKSHNTFRKELYENYKAQRNEKMAALKEQFINMPKILSYIGIPAIASNKFEADDLAGSVVKHFYNDTDKIILLTKDHDWFQLLNDKTECWMIYNNAEKALEKREKYSFIPQNNFNDFSQQPLPEKIAIFNKEAVRLEEGVNYNQIPDIKGLSGDKSDNIPGVPKVGPKTAANLLNAFGSVENIYSQIHNTSDLEQLKADWKKLYKVQNTQFDNLVEYEDQALLSTKLATIVTAINIPGNLEKYNININKDNLERIVDSFNLEEIGYDFLNRSKDFTKEI